MKKYIKLFLILILIGIISFASYLYFTRPTKSPSQNTLVELKNTQDQNLYSIKPNSQVEYNIGEVLNDTPVLVVGKTNNISGSFILDKENPQNSKINKISINARTFETDKERRDSAIVRFILRSEDADKEFINFETLEIKNLPNKFEIGQSYPVSVVGDLTISGVTNQVLFETTIHIEEEDKVRVTGESTILYKDFNLTVPELPFLADIDDEVTLKLEIFAEKE